MGAEDTLDDTKRPSGWRQRTPGDLPPFYRRWLSPESYLVLHLVAGFVLALAAWTLFDFVEDKVFSTHEIRAADARAQQLAHEIVSPHLTSLMVAISFLGNPPVVASFAIALVALLLKTGSRRRLYAFLATMGGGGMLLLTLKQYYHRARPATPLTTAHGYSFPSGHAMGSMLFYGSL